MWLVSFQQYILNKYFELKKKNGNALVCKGFRQYF